MSQKGTVTILSICYILAMPSVGHSQSNQDVAQAQKLFEAARQEMVAGDFEHACPNFAESLRLAPAAGTLLNLAVCHESQGLLATAWLEFVEAARVTSIDADRDAAAFAEEHARGLWNRLQHAKYPHLRILLSEQLPKADVAVTLDHVTLAPATLNMDLPVDPGEHQIIASDGQGHTWQGTVVLNGAELRQATIPPLAPMTSKTAEQPPANPPVGEPLVGTHGLKRPIPVGVYVGLGVTAIGVVGAVVTSVIAHNRYESYNEMNVDSRFSLTQRQDAHDSVRNMQLWNIGLIGVAAMAGAATGVLYAYRPTERVARVSPWVSTHGGGLSLTGTIE